jgi:flagellar biosynthesis GTPase FlhF
MKSIAFCSLILFGFSLWTVSPANAAESRAIKRIQDLSHRSGKLGTYHALLIGIDDYKDPKIPDLKTAVADAEAVARVLKERYGFDDVTVIKNRRATKFAIDRAFRKKIKTLGSDDSILIYYAGHGELDRLTKDGWWVPVDARAGDNTTYFDNTIVQKYLRAMQARHVLLVSDSCYSGALFGESRALPPLINDRFYLGLYNDKSRWGMTSGNKTPVSDQGFGGHSVFAYQFIRKLEKNVKPYLTPREIYADIGPVVRNNSEQMPLCRPIKMTGDQGGEFVFVTSGPASGVRPSTKPAVSSALDEERKRMAEERARLEAERKRLDEEKRRLDEERKQAAERERLAKEKAKLEAERKRLAEERRRLEEAKKRQVARIPSRPPVSRPEARGRVGAPTTLSSLKGVHIWVQVKDLNARKKYCDLFASQGLIVDCDSRPKVDANEMFLKCPKLPDNTARLITDFLGRKDIKIYDWRRSSSFGQKYCNQGGAKSAISFELFQ